MAPITGTMLSGEKFQELLHHLTTNLRNTQTPLLSNVDNKFQIACSEYYMSQGLTFKFDGDHEKLALWIKKFKALWAHALWHDTTYLIYDRRKYKILNQFTMIKRKQLSRSKLQLVGLPRTKCLVLSQNIWCYSMQESWGRWLLVQLLMISIQPYRTMQAKKWQAMPPSSSG